MYFYQGTLNALIEMNQSVQLMQCNSENGKDLFNRDLPGLICFGLGDCTDLSREGFGNYAEYSQGVMSGQAQSLYLLTPEAFPFQRKGEKESTHSTLLFNKGFVFINNKNELCSLSLTCRRDDPSKWVLLLSVGANKAFKEQYVYVLSSVKWPSFYQRLKHKFNDTIVFKSFIPSALKRRFKANIGNVQVKLLCDELLKNIDGKGNAAATFKLFLDFYTSPYNEKSQILTKNLQQTDFSNPVLNVLSVLNVHKDFKDKANAFINKRETFYKNVSYFEEHFMQKQAISGVNEIDLAGACFKIYMKVLDKRANANPAVSMVKKLFKTALDNGITFETIKIMEAIEEFNLVNLSYLLDFIAYFSKWNDTSGSRTALANAACIVFADKTGSFNFQWMTSQLNSGKTYLSQALLCQLWLDFPEAVELGLAKGKTSLTRLLRSPPIIAFFNVTSFHTFCKKNTYTDVISFLENISIKYSELNKTQKKCWEALLSHFAFEFDSNSHTHDLYFEACLKLSALNWDGCKINVETLETLEKLKVAVDTENNVNIKDMLKQFYKTSVSEFYDPYINSALTPEDNLALYHEILGAVLQTDAIAKKIYTAIMSAKFDETDKLISAEYMGRITSLRKQNIITMLRGIQDDKKPLKRVISKLDDMPFFNMINTIECQLDAISLKTDAEKKGLQACRKALYEVIDNQLQGLYPTTKEFKAALLAAQEPFDKMVNSPRYPILKKTFVFIANAVIWFFTGGVVHAAHQKQTGDYWFFTRNTPSKQMRDVLHHINIPAST